MGNLSLLSRAITNEDWHLILDALQFRPEEASKWSKRYGFFNGWSTARVLPIHEALVAHAPLECIQAIVENFPQGLLKPESSFQRLPLHCACRADAGPRIILYLVQKYKEACGAPDMAGRVPLHYALTSGANRSVIDILLNAYPRAARARDIFGWTIVHVAVAVGAPIDIVERLLNQSPESVIMRTSRGRTVHAVILRGCPHENDLRALVTRVKRKVEVTMHLPHMKRKLSPSQMVMT
mmetsp:Transcript_27023/g.62202  ORF Transcript_27023/g.62202 Transcript_27023/m.62202 type:complete len:238 (+) Transcript_27023:136-849(+)|eukprot:CAMPEP_0168724210 /NCGR_PEP_ID=MMETSP0724-20121128/3517_1 /TAXON_ID=265536 /ORGANISM="Amphiprora sp., Strain CCMP467" /LENGTH=237 /DNA_ID=CAMNT_0008770949 /DNA_START=45 /DNA_END=758 /DNA_ORIENTATION=-